MTEARQGGDRSRLLVSVLDQVASSGTNFLLVIAVARSSSPGDFGLFAIAYGVVALGLGLQRNAIGVPLGLDLPEAAGPAEQALLVRRSLAVSLVLGLALGVAVIGCSLAVGWSTTLGGVLLALGVAVPFAMAQDTLRYAAMAWQRPGNALVSDGAWFVVVAAALAASGLLPDDVPAPVPWAVGAGLSLVVLWVGIGVGAPVLGGSLAWVREDRRRANLAGDAVLGSAAPVLVAALTAWLVAPGATAALRGASTMFGPISVLLSVVPLAVTPELSRRGLVAGVRVVRWYCGALALVELGWVLLLVLTPDQVGTRILGDTWPSAQELFPIAVVEALAITLWTACVAVLRVADRTGQALRLRVLYASGYVALATGAALWLGTPEAVLWGMTAAGIAVAVASAVAARGALSAARSPRPSARR